MAYKLQELIDMQQFQALQDRLNEIYSFPSAIIDNEGNILTATAWQDVCTRFHRKNPECERDCLHSDQYILDHIHEANPAVSYICPRGLTDNATPIIINGIHYGNFFTGQFFLDPPDLEFFRGQAKRFGFDEQAYLEAVKKVPIWSREQLNNYLFFIKGLIEIISTAGLKGLAEIENKKKIEQSEVRANTILSKMTDGFIVSSPDGGQVIEVNQAMCQMLGYTRPELMSMKIADIEANDTQIDVEQRIQKIQKNGSDHFESRFRCKDKTVIDVDVTITYLPEQNLIFGFHRDISARKQAEKEMLLVHRELKRLLEESDHSRKTLLNLAEDQKKVEEEIRQLNQELEQRVLNRTARLEAANQELEAFSFSVSHDLRAPLRAVIGYCDVLLAEYQDQLDDDGRHYLQRIESASHRMNQLINDLLNLSRITRQDMQIDQVDLTGIVQLLSNDLQAQHPERQLIFEITPGLIVEGDYNLLKIALENLLNNAVKFTSGRSPALIKFGVDQQAPEKTYFVQDNGVGFNMAYISKLFSPFQRLHGVQEFPGTGIGLVIVKRIINRHGGRIWPEAAVDQGATFYFTLGEPDKTEP